MKTAREVAHAIVCERQDSEWCHWSSNRESHAHYCDSLTAAITERDAEHAAQRDRYKEALRVAREALERLRKLVCKTCRRDADANAALEAIAKILEPNEQP